MAEAAVAGLALGATDGAALADAVAAGVAAADDAAGVAVEATDGAAVAEAFAAGVAATDAATTGVALGAAFFSSFILFPRCGACAFAGAEALAEAGAVSAVFAPVAADSAALGVAGDFGEFGADAGAFAAGSCAARSFV